MKTMRTMRKWGWLILIAGVALAGGGVWWWRSRAADSASRYATAVVTRGDLTEAVTATGQLTPLVNVTVGSQISGTIAQLFADYNSPVTNGQVLALIDSSTYRANLLQAEAELASARAQLALARINARRAAELFADKLIPQADHDTAQAALQQAEAAVLNREAALYRAQVDLNRCTIYSPVNGIVISRNVDVGQTVAASLSAPTLFIIANDLTKMQIEANVAEADIGRVEAGQDVEFSVDAFPERIFRGRVVQIRNSPQTVQNVVTYTTIIEVSNPDLKLRPGMTANMSIIIAQRSDVLRVANAALRFRPPGATNTATAVASASGASRRGGTAGSVSGRAERLRGERQAQRTVYVLRNGEPVAVPIRVGISDGVFTEVIDGLSESNVVITAAITPTSPSTRTTNPLAGGGPRFR